MSDSPILTPDDSEPEMDGMGDVVIEPVYTGSTYYAALRVLVNGETVLASKIDLAKQNKRAIFAAELIKEIPALNVEQIEEMLLDEIDKRSEYLKQLQARKESGEEDHNTADRIVAIATDDSFLWRDEQGKGYATVKIDDHFENYAIKSRAYRLYLRRRLREEENISAPSETLTMALEELESKAIFEGTTETVAVRVAESDGAIYLDLADEKWRVVKIDKSGWQVMTEPPPVRFIRPRGLLPLPTPEAGGSINKLREFLNVKEESDFVLIVAFQLAALKPKGPFPILAIFGEQGTGKSNAQRMVKAMIDPNAAPLRSEPREIRDLIISATNSWMIGFDNLSRIPNWLSDALCRLSTGGGFATRELYSDAEETIFEAQRPILFNGIEDVATRSDLLDRCLLITLAPIPEGERRDEKDLWKEFNAALPGILGALLDGVAAGLRNIDSIKLDRLPRMADFAKWVSACETGLHWEPGTFMSAYQRNRASANQTAIESSSIGAPVIAFVETLEEPWEGSATELKKALEERLPRDGDGDPRTPHGWPKTAKGLSGELRRISPNLRSIGIRLGFDREAGGDRKRLISIYPRPKNASQTSQGP